METIDLTSNISDVEALASGPWDPDFDLEQMVLVDLLLTTTKAFDGFRTDKPTIVPGDRAQHTLTEPKDPRTAYVRPVA